MSTTAFLTKSSWYVMALFAGACVGTLLSLPLGGWVAFGLLFNWHHLQILFLSSIVITVISIGHTVFRQSFFELLTFVIASAVFVFVGFASFLVLMALSISG